MEQEVKQVKMHQLICEDGRFHSRNGILFLIYKRNTISNLQTHTHITMDESCKHAKKKTQNIIHYMIPLE